MPNQLARESSPYLLQHANNPVDWHPWCEEALRKAKEENKPIFLSIGYAACHWCHVMEHESFEDPETAEILNKHFINIKVDREERPDLDAIYMEAVVGLTGHGGWPMSVWLTPDGVPFYAGTYFPKTPRYGMPSFKQVLLALAEAWMNDRARIDQTKEGLLEFYRRESPILGQSASSLRASLFDTVMAALESSFDRAQGGWGRAPKFPQPMTIEFLLRYDRQTGDTRARQMIDKTLTAMAEGGIYDQLGGGFHRYATDARWLVPHFEKMLYDNSQLARAYLHAWQLTGNPLYRRIAVETLDYVAREMTHPAGGFYSTQDADSEGEEGKFFVWSLDEVQAILGAEAEVFCAVYDVTRAGNWEGHNILHVARPVEEVAQAHGLDQATLEGILAEARRKLFAAREQRVKPGRDDKVLTSWNGLMLAAFAEAARGLGRDDYRQIAVRNAEFLWHELRGSNGRLFRTWKDGHGAKLNAYLEDYTHLAEGLIELYQTTFDPRWFIASRELIETTLTHFRAEDGSFYDTSDDHEQLVVRPRDLQDNAVPSGNAMAATVLLKLGAYTGEGRYIDIAESLLGRVQDAIQRYPTAFGQWLVAYDLAINPPKEIALVGDPTSSATQALLDVVFDGFRPNQIVALKRAGETSPIPLLAGREAIAGQATAYVCRRFACQMPVAEPAALRKQLSEKG
ncbi:MAG: thioredoxin domain-containing protein [Anaerolineae bacterium]|nr:thioredoxin domain-containing protein [Thermoflexales bacterium]MDW8408235.1 thioredoxin domain-containing protein [Anaerolineae bacterium]